MVFGKEKAAEKIARRVCRCSVCCSDNRPDCENECWCFYSAKQGALAGVAWAEKKKEVKRK